MNLVDGYVTNILSKSYCKYDKWWVDVEYNTMGVLGETSLMFDYKECADNVYIGQKITV